MIQLHAAPAEPRYVIEIIAAARITMQRQLSALINLHPVDGVRTGVRTSRFHSENPGAANVVALQVFRNQSGVPEVLDRQQNVERIGNPPAIL